MSYFDDNTPRDAQTPFTGEFAAGSGEYHFVRSEPAPKPWSDASYTPSDRATAVPRSYNCGESQPPKPPKAPKKRKSKAKVVIIIIVAVLLAITLLIGAVVLGVIALVAIGGGGLATLFTGIKKAEVFLDNEPEYIIQETIPSEEVIETVDDFYFEDTEVAEIEVGGFISDNAVKCLDHIHC